MLKELVHLVAALQFSYAIYYDLNHVKVPTTVSNIGLIYGGKFKFLTFWDAIIQCIYFWISFINDFYGSNKCIRKNSDKFTVFKDYFFCCIAFPLSSFVCLTFWGLYAIDRELVFPVVLDAYFPNWLNHIMHTNILIFTVVEFFTTFRRYPERSQGLTILTGFMLMYLFWVFFIYLKSGYWVYPIMEVLNWPSRLLFFFVMLLFIEGIYISQDKLNEMLWAKHINVAVENQGKQKAQ